MNPRIKSARVLGHYRVELVFTDGSRGTADLAALLAGRTGVFAALHDPAYFAQVTVDAEAGTLMWPNGVDLDPDVLFELARAASVGGSAPR